MTKIIFFVFNFCLFLTIVSCGETEEYDRAETLILAFRCRRNFSVVEMKIYSELSIAFDTCFEANREIIHVPKRKRAVIF